MVVLNLNFTTIRADVESVGEELDQTVKESRIVLGPGARRVLGEDNAAE